MIQLLPFQQAPVDHLLAVQQREVVSVNASDTGTGKTYMALRLAEVRNTPFLIICPKGTVPDWQRLITEFGLEKNCIDVRNIESIKTGKYPYFQVIPKSKQVNWVLPDNSLAIMDEAHYYSGQSSQNAYSLAYLKTNKTVHTHLMSATLADSPAKFRAFGFLMGLHQFHDFRAWAIEQGCYPDLYGNLQYRKVDLQKGSVIHSLHKHIFPKFGVRLRTDDLEGFPENTLCPTLIASIGNAKYLKRVADHMRSLDEGQLDLDAGWEHMETTRFKNQDTRIELLRGRQRAELLKLPYLVKQIQQCIEEGHSAAVFLNFRPSTRWLKEMLAEAGVTAALVTGDITNKTEREHNKALFQSNQVFVFIGTSAAAGTGINLHDLNGRARRSFISPSFSVVLFKQVLGRIHRAGSLSPAIQQIICMQDTEEEMVLTRLNQKLKNLNLLNDGDLLP